MNRIQIPIYFVSRVLQGFELDYPEEEKLIQKLVRATKYLRRYFHDHPIMILSDRPIKQALIMPEKSRRSLEAKAAFQKRREFIKILPTLTAPVEGEGLFMHITASFAKASAVFSVEMNRIQIPIYFVSRVLQGFELDYPEEEKLIQKLVRATKYLRRYFHDHPITILSDRPIKQALTMPEKSRRVAKWAIELGDHELGYKAYGYWEGSESTNELYEPSQTDGSTLEELLKAVTNDETKHNALIASLRPTGKAETCSLFLLKESEFIPK
ncbi:hypothetical protein CTI12_AA581580 [Artemisia annua]|uniref:Reverse transcriptase RNase H-like domain-containing protein n=1 Tax=Artemisia annua TaxID=35608 RepID=A0A2U1KP13_ARTAN|nr:hypothetical protein CTI12_AA581580 [Artemisia annua]